MSLYHLASKARDKGVVIHSTYLSICTGAGGLDLGVIAATGGQAVPVCYVENEITAASILVARMEEGALPGAPIWSDIKSFNWQQLEGKVDGIIGGHPCQPFSSVGTRHGTNDTRHLWPFIYEGIKTIKPRWLFFENVPNHLSIGFYSVAEDLRSLGYIVKATLVTAEEVGAPHKRERLFFMGHPTGAGLQRLNNERKPDTQGWQAKNGQNSQPGSPPSTFAPRPNDPVWAEIPDRLHPSRLKSDIRRMGNGMADGMDLPYKERIRIVGNGVVPQQAAHAWKILTKD